MPFRGERYRLADAGGLRGVGLVAAGDCEDVSGGVGTVVRSQPPRTAAAAMSAITWMLFPFMLPPMPDVRVPQIHRSHLYAGCAESLWDETAY